MNKPLDPIANPEDLATIGLYLDQFEKDTTFLNDHRLGWISEYPDKWVVVFEEAIVATGDTIELALAEAREQGVPVHLAAVEFLSKEPITMILLEASC